MVLKSGMLLKLNAVTDVQQARQDKAISVFKVFLPQLAQADKSNKTDFVFAPAINPDGPALYAKHAGTKEKFGMESPALALVEKFGTPLLTDASIDAAAELLGVNHRQSVSAIPQQQGLINPAAPVLAPQEKTGPDLNAPQATAAALTLSHNRNVCLLKV